MDYTTQLPNVKTREFCGWVRWPCHVQVKPI